MKPARDLSKENGRKGWSGHSCGWILSLCTIGLLAGCATAPQPERVAVEIPIAVQTPVSVQTPVAEPQAPKAKKVEKVQQVKKPESVPQTTAADERAGELVRFDQIRTVLVTGESVELPEGRVVQADEIRPLLEKALIARNFRIFSGPVSPEASPADLTRRVGGQLLIEVKAKSEPVNSTGKFLKYRARAEATAIRGRDGTKLAMATVEEVGPRQQDAERAGELALRQVAQALADQLIQDLEGKSDQLVWSALVVRGLDDAGKAKSIATQLEAQFGMGHVELLGWDETSRTGTYEIMHGLMHDSDLLNALAQIQGLRIKATNYQPSSMETLRKTMANFK